MAISHDWTEFLQSIGGLEFLDRLNATDVGYSNHRSPGFIRLQSNRLYKQNRTIRPRNAHLGTDARVDTAR